MTTTLTLTAEQKAIMAAQEDLVAITAYAGTGKTFTLKVFAENHPREKILYLAFNKALAEDSKNDFKACPNVLVKTIHSLAYAHVGNKYAKTIGEIKALTLIPYVKDGKSASKDDEYLLAKEVNQCLNDFFMSSSSSIEQFFKDNKHKTKVKLDGSRKKPKDISKIVLKVWNDSINGNFHMPHNGYLKIFQMNHADSLDTYDRILVDEAQDLNDCMISLITGCRAKKIFVGDPFQQIYAFNGAVNALSKKALSGAATYYLTQSFRCPREIAQLANNYLTLLEAPKPFTGVAKAKPNQGASGKLLIARTNAGLFDFVAKNIDQNRFFYNGGFESYQFEIILDLVNLLNNKQHFIKDAFVKQFDSIEEIENYAEKVNDTVCATRLKIAKRYQKEAFFIYKKMLNNKTDEYSADYIATTAHKIKGREYGQVVLLEDFINLDEVLALAYKLKKIKEEKGQLPESFPCLVNLEELRLLYMAITRSKDSLEIPKQYQLTQDIMDQFQELVMEGYIELID
ncbi:MAG: AAA family ATPase [Deltaproteobacteria bacterium]|jgi:superfamily I DNA/RNA helicase|nr:AAA family ATPase [Deltaproteobacteria bacterium]